MIHIRGAIKTIERIKLLMITPMNKELKRYYKGQFNNFIQLTMPYLAGFVDEDVYEIELVDEYNQKVPYSGKYQLAAITVNTPNAIHCYEMAQRFKRLGVRTVFGGPHATLLPYEAAEHCDHLIVGEAEETWPQFLADYAAGRAKRVYRAERCPELIGLPLPRRDLVKGRFFTRGAVFATRGCPYHCSYCSLKQIYHPRFRKRPIDEVINDIRNIENRYFVFWDDNLFAEHDYAKALLQELVKLRKRWAAQVTLNTCYDEELLRLARAAGCLYLFIGLESFSKESLGCANKYINDVEEYRTIISMIHKHGICVQAGIIFGFDGDREDVFRITLKACEELGIDGATISVLTPLPGTPLYSQFKGEGRLISHNWAEYNGKTCVTYRPRHMSPRELYEGYMWFRKNFYSWRSIFKRLKASRTNLLYSFVLNVGYKIGLNGSIPTQNDHPHQSNPTTDSNQNRPPIPE